VISLDYANIDDGSADFDSVPRFYAIENGGLKIYGADAQAYSLTYKPKLPALTDAQPTNWLLDIAEDLYLFSSTLEAARHVRNIPVIEIMTASTAAALESVRSYTKRRGVPSKGGLQIRLRCG
jgi:hypothetical protein